MFGSVSDFSYRKDRAAQERKGKDREKGILIIITLYIIVNVDIMKSKASLEDASVLIV